MLRFTAVQNTIVGGGRIGEQVVVVFRGLPAHRIHISGQTVVRVPIQHHRMKIGII